MIKDVLIVFRNTMLNDSTITSLVSTNVRVREQPKKRVAKQITLRKNYGISNSILDSANPTIFVTVWVKEKEEEEPYKVCATLVHRILDLFNRKGESLNSDNLIVNQIVKTDAEIFFDDEQKLWTGVITFDVVTND